MQKNILVQPFISCNHNGKLVFCGLLLLSYLLVMSNISFSSFKDTHYLFSIQQGFYSRALVGSIIQLLVPNHYNSVLLIHAIQGFFTLMIATSFSLLGYYYWKAQKTSTSLLIALAFITAPGTIQFFARDSGRFDQIGYIVVIVALLLMFMIKRKWHWLVIVPISILLVLLHEALLLLAAPVLVAASLMMYLNNGNKINDAFKAIFLSSMTLMPATIIAIYILTILRLDYDPNVFNETFLYLDKTTNYSISKGSLMVQYRSMEDNIFHTFNAITSLSRLLNLFLAFIALLPSGIVAFYFLLHTMGGLKRKQFNYSIYNSLIKLTILMYCFAPIMLCFIGHDYPRWVAAIVTNLFILAIFAAVNRPLDQKNAQNSSYFPFSKHYLYIIIILSLVLGPISATSPPDALRRIASITLHIVKMLI